MGLAMENKDNFAYNLERFFLSYLPNRRCVSKNTITSYRDVFKIFLRFLSDEKNCQPNRIKMGDFTRENILDFMKYLVDVRKVSQRSRNQRLSALYSFVHYLQFEYPESLSQWQKILSIPICKCGKPQMQYLTIKQIELLMRTVGKYGNHRDKAIILLLYDTGARVQELVDISFGDLSLVNPATLILHGKGNKTRVVPLLNTTVRILKSYIDEIEPANLSHPLFRNRNGEAFTRFGVMYILKKYAKLASREDIKIPDKLTPHMLRHSKAMHLLEAGCSVIEIQRLLGHSDIRTTTIYAQTNVEMIRKSLEKVSYSYVQDSRKKKDWQKSKKLMAFLNSL